MIGTIFNNSQNQHNVIIENVLLKLINQLKICYSFRFITSGWHIKGKDFLNTEQGGKKYMASSADAGCLNHFRTSRRSCCNACNKLNDQSLRDA